MKRIIIVLIVLMASSTAVLAQTSNLTGTPVNEQEQTTLPTDVPEPQATPEPEPTEPEPTDPEPESTIELKSTLEFTVNPDETSELVSTFEATSSETTPPSKALETQRPELYSSETDAPEPAPTENEEKEKIEQRGQLEEGETEKKKHFEDEGEDSEDYKFEDDSVTSSINSIYYLIAVFVSTFVVFCF